MAKEILDVGPWSLFCDPAQIREEYSQFESGSAEECNCIDCQRFIDLREKAHPVEAVGILDRLGIDYHKESDLSYSGPIMPNGHEFTGSFEIFASVKEGKDKVFMVGETYKLYLMNDLDSDRIRLEFITQVFTDEDRP